MKFDDYYYCNICGKSTQEAPKTIFVQGICDGEAIHVCTSCIPTMVHGDGNGVLNNTELTKVLEDRKFK